MCSVQRILSVSTRTIHIAAFAMLVGGHTWDVAPERLLAAWGDLHVPLLLLVLTIASAASHMPGRFRHAPQISLW